VRDADELKLWVEDNGVGFDAAPHVNGDRCPAGVGLPSIRKRVEATDGELVLESKPNSGALIGAIWTMAPRAPA
jgi:signal transduction histidine kinase